MCVIISRDPRRSNLTVIKVSQIAYRNENSKEERVTQASISDYQDWTKYWMELCFVPLSENQLPSKKYELERTGFIESTRIQTKP